MAFCSAYRLCTYAIILSFCFTSGGFGQAGVFGQVGGFGLAGGVGPAQIITKALSCFSDKYIYHSCEESYRLDQSGELHVPPEYVNEYCEGPCQKETGLVLHCIHGIFANFIFYNKATIAIIKDTIHEACSYGPERGNNTPAMSRIIMHSHNVQRKAGQSYLVTRFSGNFDVSEHLEADSAVSTDFAYKFVSSITWSLVGLMFIL